MNAKKPKHSKYKNTGLIFEFLMRQVTSDVLNNVKDSIALNLIKKRFNENTVLGKELALYNILITQKFEEDKRADYFISEVLRNRDGLNNSLLRREKYNVIKSIKENYNVDHFFSTNVSNYKTYASIFKLFEYSKNLSPSEKTESYFNILEHVTTKPMKKDTNLNPTQKYLKEDEDLRILTYKIILEKFNSKYSTLSNNQRSLLRNYINNISNVNSLKEYMESKIPSIKKELKNQLLKVKNKIVKIKLKEAINSINKFCSVGNGKLVKDSAVVQMMRYFELIKELKKNG